jgi:hypothetical protein
VKKNLGMGFTEVVIEPPFVLYNDLPVPMNCQLILKNGAPIPKYTL